MTRVLAAFLTILIATPVAGDGILRRGLGPEPDSLDIHQAQGLAAINLIRDIREGLVTFDEATPRLAARVERNISTGNGFYKSMALSHAGAQCLTENLTNGNWRTSFYSNCGNGGRL